TLFVVQCVAVALRPTNDPMHGFAKPTIRTPKQDAISQKPFWRFDNMVGNRMLQIQHTAGNHLLTRLNNALKSAHFEWLRGAWRGYSDPAGRGETAQRPATA